MKKQIKRTLAALLAALLLMTAFPLSLNVFAATPVASGKDDGVSWNLYSNGLLTVKGKVLLNCPWSAYKDSIKAVKIYNGAISISMLVFSGCSKLASITIPDSVTEIGEEAFAGTAYYNNQSNWQNGVLYIGKHLICAKSSIKGNYKIKDGTICMADKAFFECKQLTGVTVPKSLKVISRFAFLRCTSLKSVSLPSTVTSMEWGAFADCSALTSFTIPKSVTTLDSYVFGGAGLKSIVIPETITKISLGAFEGCNNLVSVTLPNTIEGIDNWAFCGSKSLKTINIPQSVKWIGYEAFYDCTSLSNITIQNPAVGISVDAFYKTAHYNNKSNWKNGVLYIGNHLIKANKAISGDCKIKNGTTSIASYAFEECTKLKSITMPDSVCKMSDGAFGNCKALEAAKISNTLKEIEGGVFSGCAALKSIEIPSGVTRIGYDAFSGCKALKSVTLPKGVTTIEGEAFSDCTGLKSVSATDGIEYIGGDAFKNTAYYKNSSNWKNNALYLRKYLLEAKKSISGAYKIAAGTVCMASHAFSGCKKLTSVIIPDTVTEISWGAFEDCVKLSRVTIPNSVTAIEADAFQGCTALKALSIPDSVVSMNEYAFGSYESAGDLSSLDLKITGFYGSEAEVCAKKAGITFVAAGVGTAKNLRASSSPKSVKLVWKKAAGVPGYTVYQYNTAAKKYELLKYVTTNSYTVNGLKPGTNYRFCVRVKKVVDGKILWSSATAISVATRPTDVKITSLASAAEGKATVKYSRSNGATGYLIQYSLKSDFSSLVKSKAVSGVSLTLTGLTSGKIYYVRIRPFVASGGKRYYSPAYSAVRSVRVK